MENQSRFEKEIEIMQKERGWWNKNSPTTLAKCIAVETGELLELFQWEEISKEDLMNNPELHQKVQDELGDIFIYATELAQVLSKSVEDIILHKLEKAKAKYSLEKLGSHPDAYKRIHKEHRERGV